MVGLSPPLMAFDFVPTLAWYGGKSKTSYRAEIAAVLSLVLFNKHLSLFHKLPLPLILHNLANRKSFLHKYSAYIALTGTNTFSNGAFSAEWDLINQIQFECNSLCIDLQLTHIPSYQDNNNQYATLALDAQLNVDAN